MFDNDELLSQFCAAGERVRIPGWPCHVYTERLCAPHRQPKLPSGWAAVYVFSLSQEFGANSEAGPGRVLKVGKVGPKSGPRFLSQHYGLSARSTLARSLLRHEILWPWLGLQDLTEANVKQWMLTNLDRTHFFVEGNRPDVLAAAEVYVRALVGSVFEGS